MAEEKEQKQMERQHRGLARRGEFTPSLFAMSPREFLSASPFELMRRFSEEMDRLFTGGREYREVWTPDIEVKEQDSNLVICADLPGLSKEDVKVEATDEGLVIQGERKREEEQRERGFYRSERAYGRFYRLIPLPESAQLENAKAQFSNGVLEVVIPVSEAEHKKREIPIEVEEAKTRTSGGGT
ncbi:MAG: Hsp20/alpha crystallin family protein [Rhodospirillales bacterium]